MSTADSLTTRSSFCVCESAQMCASIGAGHGMSVLRARLAAATPSGWRDGVVLAVEGRWISVGFLDGASAWLWNHESLADSVGAGEPVALHRVYGVLASGEHRFSVALT